MVLEARTSPGKASRRRHSNRSGQRRTKNDASPKSELLSWQLSLTSDANEAYPVESAVNMTDERATTICRWLLRPGYRCCYSRLFAAQRQPHNVAGNDDCAEATA